MVLTEKKPKAVVKSKSIWFYGLSLIATIGTVLLGDESFKALAGDNVGYLTSFMALVGLALRFVTTDPIVHKKNMEILEMTDPDDPEGP